MLLRDTIKDYKRNDLYEYSRELGIKGCSSLKKEQMIDRICEYLLGKGVMTSRLGILTDREFDIFERALTATVSLKEADEIECAEEAADVGYLVVENKRASMPEDVKEAFLTNVKGSRFDAMRRTLSWIKQCMNFAEELYGVVPEEQMVNLVNSRPGFDAGAEEIAILYGVFPPEKKTMVYEPEKKAYVSELFLEGEERAWLDFAQKDKPFYTPNHRQIMALYKNMYLQDTPAYQKFMAFLNDKVPKDAEIVKDVVSQVWTDLSSDLKDYKEVIKWIIGYPELQLSDKDVFEVAEILKDVNNSTRMIAHRGFTPDEISQNNRKGPVKPAETIEKNMRKVYPNDPCPCGSGKKYKKCCGRK